MRLRDRFRRSAPAFRTRLTVELARVEEPPAPAVAPLVLPPRPVPERPRRRSIGMAALYGGAVDPSPYATGQTSRRRWADDKPHLDLDSIREELHTPRIPWWEQRDS